MVKLVARWAVEMAVVTSVEEGCQTEVCLILGMTFRSWEEENQMMVQKENSICKDRQNPTATVVNWEVVNTREHETYGPDSEDGELPDDMDCGGVLEDGGGVAESEAPWDGAEGAEVGVGDGEGDGEGEGEGDGVGEDGGN